MSSLALCPCAGASPAAREQPRLGESLAPSTSAILMSKRVSHGRKISLGEGGRRGSSRQPPPSASGPQRGSGWRPAPQQQRPLVRDSRGERSHSQNPTGFLQRPGACQ